MDLHQTLEYFGNPTGKMYDPNTGDVYIPMGQDGGETLYLRLFYIPHKKSWSADKKSSFIPENMKSATGVTDYDLVRMAENH